MIAAPLQPSGEHRFLDHIDRQMHVPRARGDELGNASLSDGG